MPNPVYTRFARLVVVRRGYRPPPVCRDLPNVGHPAVVSFASLRHRRIARIDSLGFAPTPPDTWVVTTAGPI
jgi:hypothetical protein